MYRFNLQQGFTLIELLVVMVLLSLSLSIVIPLTIENVEKARVNGERTRVLMFIDKVKNDSLFLSEPLSVQFKGKLISAEGDKYQTSMALSYLSFGHLQCNVTPTAIESEKGSVLVSSEKRSWKFAIESGKASWNDAD